MVRKTSRKDAKAQSNKNVLRLCAFASWREIIILLKGGIHVGSRVTA